MSASTTSSGATRTWASPGPRPTRACRCCTPPIGLSSDHWEIWQYLATGSVQITGDPITHGAAGESVAFSYRRSYDPLQNCVLIDSRRGDGEHRQIYQQPILPLGFSDQFNNTCQPEPADLQR